MCFILPHCPRFCVYISILTPNQTVGAKKKQEQRKKKKDKCPPNCPPDIDIEKEIEKEKEIDKRNKKKELELQPEEDISDEEFNWDDVLNDIGIYKS